MTFSKIVYSWLFDEKHINYKISDMNIPRSMNFCRFIKRKNVCRNTLYIILNWTFQRIIKVCFHSFSKYCKYIRTFQLDYGDFFASEWAVRGAFHRERTELFNYLPPAFFGSCSWNPFKSSVKFIKNGKKIILFFVSSEKFFYFPSFILNWRP